MTLFDVQNQLYDFYAKNDSFQIDENFNDIVAISIDKDKDKAIVSQTLERLQKIGIVDKARCKDKIWWVLVKPLNLYPQTVQLSRSTIMEIARVINEYCERVKDTENLVDQTNIQEKDIKNVLSLLQIKSKLIPTNDD